MYQRHHLHRNVNRLFDTKGMNRISGKPLKTRGSGTLGVALTPPLVQFDPYASRELSSVTTLQEKSQLPIISWRVPCLFPETFSKMAHMAESHFRGNLSDRFIGVFNEGSGFGEAVFHEVLVRGCLEA